MEMYEDKDAGEVLFCNESEKVFGRSERRF
jgi:hypothetical protein